MKKSTEGTIVRMHRCIAVVGLLLLSGCNAYMQFPIGKEEQENLKAKNVNVIAITSDNILEYRSAKNLRIDGVRASNPPRDPSPYVYHIGSGDQLRIQSWATPERSSPGDIKPVSEGPVVNEKGEFFYPFVGTLKARGRTVEDVRKEVTEKLRTYITDPQVEVAVSDYNAHSVTVTGSIGIASQITLTNIPLRLLSVVNKAGVTGESDLRQVVIRRRGSEYRVNLKKFIEQGVKRHNPILLPNDVIFVPPLADNKVFTFGEIGTGEIDLGVANKTLTEVLAQTGGPSLQRSDARGIFVFRRTDDTPIGFDVFQFNLQEAEALVLTSEFEMAPFDIVFVTSDPITKWNDTVGKLLSPLGSFAQIRAAAGLL